MKSSNSFKTIVYTFSSLFCFSIVACSSSKNSGNENEIDSKTLKVNPTKINISANTTKITLNISAGNYYYVRSKSTWVTPTTTAGVRTSTFELNVAENKGYLQRTDTVNIIMGTTNQQIFIIQEKREVIATVSDKSGMENDAMKIVNQISVGWNLGNTCESNNGKYFDANNFSGSETLWGNTTTTKDMITAVKNAGFNAIRIPVCWGAHLSDISSWTIDTAWMNRIKEIVDYAYSQGMYIILNSHHDGWFEFDCDAKDSAYVIPREEAIWTQIALNFRDYDEHLIFSGMNEPHDQRNNDWNAPSTERAKVQSIYEQKFINSVRSTGGKNTYRCLMVQPWCCNPAYYSFFTMPTDITSNRLICEFHYYNPWNFCGIDDTSSVRFWGDDYKQYGTSTYGTADMIKEDLATLKSTFIDKNIPVIMGEFGVNRHTFTATEITNGLYNKGEESRDYYLQWLVCTAKSYGIPAFYWDNGILGKNQTNADIMKSGSDAFALFDRSSNPVMNIYDAGAINAIIKGLQTKVSN